MALASEASRRFVFKLNTLLNKEVIVSTTKGSTYKGKLYGFDHSTLSIILVAATDSEGKRWPIVMVPGHSITELLVEETAIFDAKEFADFLVKNGIAMHQIRIYEDLNIVEVARSVRVSKDGVEGSGPLAQRIHTLYREFLRRKGVEV